MLEKLQERKKLIEKEFEALKEAVLKAEKRMVLLQGAYAEIDKLIKEEQVPEPSPEAV